MKKQLYRFTYYFYQKTKCSVDIINNSPLISIDVYLIGYGLSLDSNTYYNTEESLNEIKIMLKNIFKIN